MELAKPHLDVGVMTDRLEPMLEFWQRQVGLPFEELLPTGRGRRQHRHGMNGSVFKLNHDRDGVPPVAATGYRELRIARPGLQTAKALADPDGNRVVLVPSGADGVTGIELRLCVRDERAFHDFYGRVLGLERCGERRYRCGDSLLSFEASSDAVGGSELRGPGYRYMTIQIHDVNREHAEILDRGGAEGAAPVTLGEVARISFVRDPDGNWIELSQRASLTGPLSAD